MGGNKSDKKKEEELARQQAEDRRLFTQSFQQANTPSPLQQRREASTLSTLDWEEGKGEFEGKPLDVMNMPGLGPSRSLYEHARAGQQSERQGIGALRMGLNASDPGLAANLAEQSKLRREQDASGQLEQAVAMKLAEAKGSALPLIGLNQQRTMGLASLSGNQSANSTGLWSQFRVRPSGWATFAQGLGQGVAGGLSAIGGNPGAFA